MGRQQSQLIRTGLPAEPLHLYEGELEDDYLEEDDLFEDDWPVDRNDDFAFQDEEDFDEDEELLGLLPRSSSGLGDRLSLS